MVTTDDLRRCFPSPADLGPPGLEAMVPTFIQALWDAIAHHHDGQCGYPEHVAWVEQYERALDVLERRPALAALPAAPDPT